MTTAENLTDAQAHELRLMSNVMNWPQMHLPVIKRDGSNRVGVILHTKEHMYDVFEVNQFLMNTLLIQPLNEGREPECPVHHYDSFEAVIRDGWVGD